MRTRVILSVTQGSLQGTEFLFDHYTRLVVGRAPDCDVCLPRSFENSDVSRRHCMFEIAPPLIRVRDLGSRNGTFLNGQKIGQRQATQPDDETVAVSSPAFPLRDGDVVRVGNTEFVVEIAVSAEEMAEDWVSKPSR